MNSDIVDVEFIRRRHGFDTPTAARSRIKEIGCWRGGRNQLLTSMDRVLRWEAERADHDPDQADVVDRRANSINDQLHGRTVRVSIPKHINGSDWRKQLNQEP